MSMVFKLLIALLSEASGPLELSSPVAGAVRIGSTTSARREPSNGTWLASCALSVVTALDVLRVPENAEATGACRSLESAFKSGVMSGASRVTALSALAVVFKLVTVEVSDVLTALSALRRVVSAVGDGDGGKD